MAAADVTPVELRPLLFSLAYRLVGEVGEAEDLVQEAFLRLHREPSVTSPKAFLTTVVTRLSIDHLRSARVRRQTYVGPWKIARLWARIGARESAAHTLRPVDVNGQPGAAGFDGDGTLVAVITADIADGRVQAVRVVANPDKLAGVAMALAER